MGFGLQGLRPRLGSRAWGRVVVRLMPSETKFFSKQNRLIPCPCGGTNVSILQS